MYSHHGQDIRAKVLWQCNNAVVAQAHRNMRKMLVVAINLAAGALHLVAGPNYTGPWRHFVNGYLIAITLPFAAYFLLILCEESIRILRPWLVKSALVFAIVSSAEVAQYLGKSIFGETYDVWDFAAYAAGALLGATADRLLFPRIFGFWAEPQFSS